MSAAAIEALVVLAAKYGPTAVTSIIALFKKTDPALEDVATAFEQLKTYESFGIPAVAPTAPTTATPASPS
jgi:hypothetical protein